MKKAYKPVDIADLFVEYINSGNINGLVSLYEDNDTENDDGIPAITQVKGKDIGPWEQCHKRTFKLMEQQA